jgi:hypothetical protein
MIEQSAGEFRRGIELIPGYDHRDPGKGGIHHLHLVMLVRWPLAGATKLALQLDIGTGWYPSTVKIQRLDGQKWGWADAQCYAEASAWDLNLHSARQVGENQYNRKHCDWLDGQSCWCYGWSNRAMELFKLLVDKGPDEVWAEMESMMPREIELLQGAEEREGLWAKWAGGHGGEIAAAAAKEPTP